jgi:hypothetical protein
MMFFEKQKKFYEIALSSLCVYVRVHVCARLSTFEQAGRYDLYGLKCCLILAAVSNCLSQQHALQ